MSRPSRTASTKLKTYAEKSEDSDADSDMGDESFDDDDDDPDKIEVPGGGKTLEAAVQRVNQTDTKPEIPLFGGSPMLSNHMNNPLLGGLPTNIKREPQGSSSYINNNNNNNSSIGSSSSSSGSSSNPLQQYLNTLSALQSNPNLDMTASPLFSNPNNFATSSPVNPFNSLFGNNSPFLRKFMSDPNTAFQQFYSALLGTPGQMGGTGGLQPDFLNSSLNFPTAGSNPVSVSQLWGVGKTESNIVNPDSITADEEEDHQQDEMGVAETYSDYKPAKLQIGKRHPDPVVETASLASVLPPDVTYKLHLPPNVIDHTLLSALQLEAVVYTCQQHEHHLPSGERAGFLIGDGAGVGKGRTIAGIIYENYLCGRKKSIWVSVSSDLKYDSERDLSDIGAKIDVYPLNKFKYGKIASNVKGCIFSTYASLIGESSQGGKCNTRLKQLLHWCGSDFDGVIVFDECHRAKNLCPVGATKPTKTGLTVQELQKKLPNARVVYASATGASEPRNMAYMVRLGIWGQSTPFKEFTDFIQAVERRGVGAMEIVAMDMKLRGAYIARQLSFQGVTFNIEEASLTKDFIKVYDDSVELWVELMHRFIEASELMQCEPPMKKAMWAQFWSSHQRFFKYLCIASKVKRVVNIASEAIKLGKCVVIGLQSTGEARTLDQLDKDDGELTDFVSTAKGVLQSLVEKHFPSKKRPSILKALDNTESLWDSLYGNDQAAPGPSSSSNSNSNKRKPTRKAAQKVKRHKYDSDDDDDAGTYRNADSDFELSGDDHSSESYMSDSSTNDSKPASSSEFDSDEDGLATKKRGRGRKPKKKPKIKSKTVSLNHNRPSPEIITKVHEMKDDILKKIDLLGERLPPNALDQLIDELGGPDDVAEMTGRKGRVIQSEDGQIRYESRSEVDLSLETINLTEKQRFMDGVKKIAIISEAASSGISLQSDRRAKNTLRRVHITLELPWSADRAIQQFGRTHRSNQVNAPEYVFMISDLAGENRFASVVAKRLESLGALTHGDRRATETRDLSRFHIDTKYGREALEHVMKSIMTYELPIVTPDTDFPSVEHFFQAVRGALMGVGLIVNNEENRGTLTLEKDYANMSKFLNRILGMPVKLQNALFQFFMDTLNHVVLNAKRNGRFDLGILDLGDSGSGGMKKVSMVTYLMRHATGLARIELHRLLVERGLSWDDAMEKFSELTEDEEGFYLSNQRRNMKRTAVLVCQVKDIKKEANRKGDAKPEKKLYAVYRPSTGLQMKRETLKDIESKYEKLDPELVKSHWENQFQASKKTCVHAYWRGNCRAKMMGVDCDIGLRERNYYVLSGAVLMVWSTVESVLSRRSISAKIQVVRVRDETLKIVGLLIPNHCAGDLMKELKTEAEICEEQNYQSDE